MPDGTDIYKGDVAISIRDTAGEETSAVKVRYTQNGTSTDKTCTSYTYSITADGTYTIVAYMVDEKGTQSSASTTLTFTRDTGRPNKPSITFSPASPNGKNNWYNAKTTLTATITAGSDTVSGPNQIKYRIGTSGNWTTTNAGTTTVTTPSLTANGTITIQAYTIDRAGHESENYEQKQVSRDGTAPAPTLSGTTAGTTTITTTISAGESGGSRSSKIPHRIQNKHRKLDTRQRRRKHCNKQTNNLWRPNLQYNLHTKSKSNRQSRQRRHKHRLIQCNNTSSKYKTIQSDNDCTKQ